MARFAYVGCYTSKERKGHGEGISVFEVDPGTGGWAERQLLKGIDNPSFLTLDTRKRFLYVVHGDGEEASAYRIGIGREAEPPSELPRDASRALMGRGGEAGPPARRTRRGAAWCRAGR
jgi:hypothetical protein